MDLVPKLTNNLLSVSQITQQVYKVEFYLDKCLIKNSNDDYKVVAMGVENDVIYKFSASVNEITYITIGSSTSEI